MNHNYVLIYVIKFTQYDERTTMEIVDTVFLCYPWHNNIWDIIICTACIYFAE